MSLIPIPRGRPRGVTILGYLFLGMAGALMITATRLAAAAALQHRFTWKVGLSLLLGAVLPAIWIGTAGWGMLRGHAWARSLVLAMAGLSLVLFAGTASAPPLGLRFGFTLGVLLFVGGSAWYLFSNRTSDWFRSA